MPDLKLTQEKLPLRAAMEARDGAAVVEAFAPDAVLHSPLTDGLTFTGREQIGAVIEVILEVFEEFRYTDEARTENGAFLVARAKIGGLDIEMVNHLIFDVDGQVEQDTVFFRPLPAAAMALKMIGSGLARRKGPAWAALLSALSSPLAFMTRSGDRVGVRLIRAVL